MKTTSIIFLALSILLIIAGIITCSVAVGKADTAGVSIFENTKTDAGDLTHTIDLGSENINKISLNLTDCNVEIREGGEKCEAELLNFEKYMYSISTLDSELSINDGFGWKSFVEISTGGISFDGLRYLFPFNGKVRPSIPEGAERTVIIRLPSNRNIRKIDISLENGNIIFADITTKADINAVVTEGDISVVGTVDSSASFKVSTSSGNVTYDNPLSVGNAELVTKKGDITIITPSDKTCEYLLSAPVGTVTYFGTSSGHTFNTGTTMDQKLTAISSEGNVTIDVPAADSAEAEQ